MKRRAFSPSPSADEDCHELDDSYETPQGIMELAQSSDNWFVRGVTDQRGTLLNMMIVQRPWDRMDQMELYNKYRNDFVFLGISSFTDYPLSETGESLRTPTNENYLDIFPGWLHTMRHPEEHFPSNVSLLLLSQSDATISPAPSRDYSIPKEFDFIYAGTGTDIEEDDCNGWATYAKNFSFVREALHVMCEEFNLTGVLAGAKTRDGLHSCSIPESCTGKIIEAPYLPSGEYNSYLQRSRFQFVPNVHDASPRAATQALSHDVPVLLNANIAGGWKYVNEKTGEFFTDMSDLRQSLRRILKGADTPLKYEPKKWITEHYGSVRSGKRLLKFVKDNFADRVKLPRGTTYLLTRSDR